MHLDLGHEPGDMHMFKSKNTIVVEERLPWMINLQDIKI